MPYYKLNRWPFKKKADVYLRVIAVVCCTHAEVSIGRTGSPGHEIFKLQLQPRTQN